MTEEQPPATKRVVPIKAVVDEKSDNAGLYEAHARVQARSIRGTFARWRWVMVILTQLFFYVMPWLDWGGRQALLLDVSSRRFYLLGLVLYPQDLIYLTGLLVVSALSLFLFTAVAGRLWCGYACPQSVYTEIFMWVEHWTEGDRSARIRLDRSGWTGEKIIKRGSKQIIWVLIALWTGVTFVGFFTPIRQLVSALPSFSMGPWEGFWILFYGFTTYLFAGFMREQVCKYMCPYARFQGAMFDRDTLIVTYDEARGEPRSAKLSPKKSENESIRGQSSAAGDCIDCSLCVQVCPTGIDIRKGLQYECIGCGLCVDACNSVMDRVHRPRGLIRYATLNSMVQGASRKSVIAHIFRPRVLIYSAILWLLVLALIVSLALRTPFRADVVRDRVALARITDSGQIENIYQVQIMNASEKPIVFRITARGLKGLQTLYSAPVTVNSAATKWVPVQLQIPMDSAAPGVHRIDFDVQSPDGKVVSSRSTFIVMQ
ncbi:MAG: cytochrome c oxidase accessory protein CcoG [Burkholderiaceae bacterium]|nr:cytochrome c oxidase accessory protein CcoG [Burkholderiaceae bacterium]